MNSLPLLFFSTDYYKDYNFVRLVRNYNKYIDYAHERFGEEDIDYHKVMVEWEETLRKDFYDGAREWLKKNPNSLFNKEFV